MLALLGFFLKKYWVYAAIIVAILSVAGYIEVLQWKNDRITLKYDKEVVQNLKLEGENTRIRQANAVNNGTIDELQALLDECVSASAIRAHRQEEELREYEIKLGQVQSKTGIDVQRVRKVLAGELCASVPLPVNALEAIQQ